MGLSEQVKNFLNEKDRFCKVNGIQLVHISPGYAEAEMTVTENSLNGADVVQGGAIFTLADFTFAGAANAGGGQCVSLNCSISFIRPGMPPLMRAVAREISRGKTTAVYQIEVFNADGKLAAVMTANGFVTGRTMPPPED